MILNIEGKFDEKLNKLEYQIPSLVLNRKFNYKIGVKIVHLEFLGDNSNSNNELFCVNTNLIDMSIYNSNQTIYFFWNNSNLQKISSFVTEPTFYPLQVYEIENCKITFSQFFTGKKLSIKNFLLQLEIQRSDFNARL